MGSALLRAVQRNRFWGVTAIRGCTQLLRWEGCQTVGGTFLCLDGKSARVEVASSDEETSTKFCWMRDLPACPGLSSCPETFPRPSSAFCTQQKTLTIVYLHQFAQYPDLALVLCQFIG